LTAAGRLGALVAAAGGLRFFETSFIALSFCRYNNLAAIAGATALCSFHLGVDRLS
jgi:hypothetical protein